MSNNVFPCINLLDVATSNFAVTFTHYVEGAR